MRSKWRVVFGVIACAFAGSSIAAAPALSEEDVAVSKEAWVGWGCHWICGDPNYEACCGNDNPRIR